MSRFRLRCCCGPLLPIQTSSNVTFGSESDTSSNVTFGSESDTSSNVTFGSDGIKRHGSVSIVTFLRHGPILWQPRHTPSTASYSTLTFLCNCPTLSQPQHIRVIGQLPVPPGSLIGGRARHYRCDMCLFCAKMPAAS
eukprot:2254503-Rhodomonas_salina.1